MTILEQYKYVSLIGEGYFSIVKQYRNIKTGELFAVKVLKKDFAKNNDYIHRFRREIDLLKTLSGCENIIELIDYQIDESVNLYIMPLATTNLYAYVKHNNADLNSEERIALFDQILDAIKFSHSRRVLHRDINPRNVLLFAKDHGFLVKVSDFGLGKDVEAMSAFTKSEIGSYGHLYYVAPEQREKLKNASEKSDLYSLGKLLNFIMTGKDPDTLHPCDFSTVIIRSTDQNPDSRYADASDFEKTYNQIKALLRPDVKHSGRDFTFTPTDGTHNYDWQAFHKFSVSGHYESHVYDDYIQPIVAVLSDTENLNNYYAAVGGAIEEFLAVFLDRLHECYRTTKWPFNATGTFGALLKNIYHKVSEHRAKAACLKELWFLAYEEDQWSVQRIMDGLLNSNAIPHELQTEFAMMILESHAKIEENRFARLKMSDVIRKAISQKARETGEKP